MKIHRVALFWLATFAFLGIIFSMTVPLLFEPYIEVEMISESEIGWLSSANLFGLMFGSLMSLYWLKHVPLLKLVQLLTLIIAACYGLCTLIIGSWIAYFLLFFVGILQGIMYSRTFGAFASLSEPSKGYAMYQVSMAVIGILCFILIPRLVGVIGIHSGFYILAGISVLMFFIGWYYRNIPLGQEPSKELSFEIFRDKKILGLLASVLCFQSADMSIWVYLERIAHANSISTEIVSWVLIGAFLVAILAAWSVAKLSDKRGLRLPFFIGMMVTLAALLRMVLPMDEWQYAFLSLCFNFGWVFTFTYLLTLQAYYDNSGKLIAFGAIANFAGEGIGPLLTGTLLLFFPMTVVPWVASSLIVLSLLLIYPLVAAYDKSNRSMNLKQNQ